MKISEKGLELIKHFEGYRGTAYLCAGGVMTIGYGSTRIDGHPIQRGDTITKAEAEEVLLTQITDYEDVVKRCTKGLTLTQGEFDALVSFAYNLGGVTLADSTLLKRLTDGDRKGAADQFLRWNKAKGKVLPGLTVRREAERKLFLS